MWCGWTSTSGPSMWCFYVFSPFWLRNVFRDTTARTFSTSELPKVVRACGDLTFFLLRNVLRATTACNFSSLSWPDGSGPAALASLLLDPLEPQDISKNIVIRGFSTFSRTCIFFLLTLSLLWSSFFSFSVFWLFPPLLFHLSILSEVFDF